MPNQSNENLNFKTFIWFRRGVFFVCAANAMAHCGLRPLRSVEDANAQFLSKHVIHCAYGEISCPRSSAVQAQNATGEIALSTAVSRWLPLQLFVGPAIVEKLVESTHGFWNGIGELRV